MLSLRKLGRYLNAAALFLGLMPRESGGWEQRQPRCGDHIRAKFGHLNMYHHGIYVNDDEVIHYSGAESPDVFMGGANKVISTSLSKFMKNKQGALEVRIYNSREQKRLGSPEAIVQRAKRRLGEINYNLGINNCEHFANYCTLGEHFSAQVDGVTGGVVPLKSLQVFLEARKAANVALRDREVVECECLLEKELSNQRLVAIEADQCQLAVLAEGVEKALSNASQALEHRDDERVAEALSGVSQHLGITPRHETLADIDRDFRNGKLRWLGQP